MDYNAQVKQVIKRYANDPVLFVKEVILDDEVEELSDYQIKGLLTYGTQVKQIANSGNVCGLSLKTPKNTGFIICCLD